MRLEDEIKQKIPFRTAKERAMVNLLFTTNWMVGLQKQTFKPYGITLQQFNVLRILRGQHPEPISTSDIRERMLDRMSDVSRIVDRLVRKELVERKTCKADKRLVDVVITSQGLALLTETDPKIDMQNFALGISEEQAEQLNDILDQLRSNTQKTSV